MPTVQELTLETFFPAETATGDAMRRLAAAMEAETASPQPFKARSSSAYAAAPTASRMRGASSRSCW